MEIVLASASPRRRELLEKIGLRFTVDASDYPEDVFFDLKPRERAQRVSLEKARAVVPRHPRALIIAADTFGVLRGRVLGKPRDAGQAISMLKALSGRAHLAITGFTVLESATGSYLSRAVSTRVHMRKLGQGEIESYVKTGEPLGKAGAYAIQGLGAVLVDSIEGDFYNVVGLPLSALARALKGFGVRVL